MSLPNIPSGVVSRESLRIGGGYGADPKGTSPAGGLEIDNAGNLATDGDVAIKGVIAAGSTPQTLTDTNGNIDGTKIQAGTVDTAQLADDAVDANKLDSTGTYAVAALSVAGNLTVDTKTLHVDSVGNKVGIGTASPDQALTLSGTYPHLRVLYNGGSYPAAWFGELYHNGASGGLVITGAVDNISGRDAITFKVSGTAGADGTAMATAMVIEANGEVGIGTDSPAATLDVNGDVTARGGDVVLGVDGGTRGMLTVWDGSGGNAPGCIKLCSPNGTPWYLFVEDDGTLKVHSALPTQNGDGTIVGTQV